MLMTSDLKKDVLRHYLLDQKDILPLNIRKESVFSISPCSHSIKVETIHIYFSVLGLY